MTRSSDYLAILRQHEGRDATYLKAEPALVYDRGQGSAVWDVEGRRYLDLCAGFGVMALGHHHPAHQAVFAELLVPQAPVVHGMGDVYPSTAKAELFAKLVSILPPSLSVGLLALSGGQAVELALKTAFLRKPGIVITFEGSYHGLDLGLLPLTSRQDFRASFHHWIPKDLVVELPYGCDETVLQLATRQVHQRGQQVSAILVEPIQGRAGIRPAPEGWLKKLRNAADESDAVLIYDEVFTGLGRCGQWTFAEHVACDLLCLGKALGGGMPLSACFGRPEVMQSWPENLGEAIHTGTFFGHPLACRLACATLDVLREKELLTHSMEKGLYLRQALAAEIGDHSDVLEIRGQGLMIGIALREPGMGVRLMDDLRGQEIIALVSGIKGDVLSLTPPLVIDYQELDVAVKGIGEALRRWR